MKSLPGGGLEFREPHIAAFIDWHASAPDGVKHDGAVLCGGGVHAWIVEPPETNSLHCRWCFRCGTMQSLLTHEQACA